MAERLQKWLAGQGLGSRREIERWITAGRIKVDGATAELGLKVTGDEKILIDGKPLLLPARHWLSFCSAAANPIRTLASSAPNRTRS